MINSFFSLVPVQCKVSFSLLFVLVEKEIYCYVPLYLAEAWVLGHFSNVYAVSVAIHYNCHVHVICTQLFLAFCM
jgi:hypothetical protein